MSVRWIDRMSALVKADAHGVIDALEDRALLLKQYLREAELALLQKRARCEALERELARITRTIEVLEPELDAVDRDVELALREDKDELARFAVRRLLPKRAEHEALLHEREEVQRTTEALRGSLAQQEADFGQLRERVRARLRSGRLEGEPACEGRVDEAQVELELLRRRGAAPAEAAR